MKRAMITGITSQDGSYLAEHLMSEGYEVWGFVHGEGSLRLRRIRKLLDNVRLVQGDLLDLRSLLSGIERAQPDEFYNLGAISHVPTSWQHAELTGEVTGLGVLRVLEAIRAFSDISDSRTPPGGQIRFYQASSSEMFGSAQESPQTEQTPFRPCSPYGSAKVYGHFLTQLYRQSYGMYAVSGIMFNHGSPRQGTEFLSRKVSLGVASIKLGREEHLRLGRLSARRDWGFAGDYVRAMHLMLNQEEAEDYVVGTGVTHSVEELVSQAFQVAGLDWREHVVCDTSFIRPIEAKNLCAGWAKAKENLGWQPTVGFDRLIETMVESDLRLLSQEGYLDQG